MEEYEVSKPINDRLNHFQQVFITARKLKDQAIIEKIKAKKRVEKMEWHEIRRIQKIGQANPFKDSPINSSVLRGIN